MRIRTLAAAMALAAPTISVHANDQLYGTWKLVSFVRVVEATGERTNIFGDTPKGFLNYGRDGRMYAILAHTTRPKPADMAKSTDKERIELFNSMAAYAGTFTVKGDVVTHHVDISWNESWTGSDQVRHVKLAGKRLSIATPAMASGIDGRPVVLLLEWEKVASP